MASELWGQGGTLYPPSSGFVPLVPPKSKMRLMSKKFKQTTLTTRLYKVRTDSYPQLTKTLRRAWQKLSARLVGHLLKTFWLTVRWRRSSRPIVGMTLMNLSRWSMIRAVDWLASAALRQPTHCPAVVKVRGGYGASQPVTPSAAYASEAEPPLLHITTLTTAVRPLLPAAW